MICEIERLSNFKMYRKKLEVRGAGDTILETIEKE